MSTITRRRGRPSRAEAERRVQHLLDVAAAVFIEEGYHAATMEGIAQAAGFWKQAIYQRYGDKRTLFAAVVKRLAELQPEKFPKDDDLPLEEGLQRRVRYMLNATLEPEGQAVYKLFIRNGHHFPELVAIINEAADANFRQPLQGYLRDKRRLGLIRQDINIAAAATSCTDLVYGRVMRVFLIEGQQISDRDIRKSAQQITDLLIRGLQPD